MVEQHSRNLGAQQSTYIILIAFSKTFRQILKIKYNAQAACTIINTFQITYLLNCVPDERRYYTYF